MGEEHVHGLVDEASPPLPAGIVGHLLVGEAGRQRRPQVEVPRLGNAVEGQPSP
jgi:hypothetical protein